MTQPLRHLLIATLLGGSVLFACSDAKPRGPAADTPAQTHPAVDAQHGLTPDQAAQTLVKVGDTTITLGEFADRLGSQSPYLRARYSSAERRREFLDNMVRFELLALEARKRGYETKDDVQRIRRQMMVQQMMKDLFDENGVKLSDISDAEIKAYYDAHAGEFEKPEQVRASHIQVATRAEAESLLNKLKSAPKSGPKPTTVAVAGRSGETDVQLFRTLAEKHDKDPETRSRFGDLRFFSRSAADDEKGESIPAELREAAFRLQATGDLHDGVIQTPKGFHVLLLTGRRAAMHRSLDDARRLIQNRLWRERRQTAIDAFVDELRQKAAVSENADLLEKVTVDLNAPPPPSEVEEEGEGM